MLVLRGAGCHVWCSVGIEDCGVGEGMEMRGNRDTYRTKSAKLNLCSGLLASSET